MDDLPKETAASEKRPVNWYWVVAFLSVALLGILLESEVSPEHIRFLGNAITSVGMWGAILCVLFQRGKAKPGHPHQAGITLVIDGVIVGPFLLLLGLLAASFFLGTAITTMLLGAGFFWTSLLFRLDGNNSFGGSSWFDKRCRTCGDLLINSYQFGIPKDPEGHPVTYCHRCGTNCEATTAQPLTPTAQEILDGNTADTGFGSLLVASSQIPPDPLPYPYYESSRLIGPSILVIFMATFISQFLKEGPYENLILPAIIIGIAFCAFASRANSTGAKVPCPHCQADLFLLAFARGGSLRRNLRYRRKNGHYVVVADPRYCPYCGKNVEVPVANPQDRVD